MARKLDRSNQGQLGERNLGGGAGSWSGSCRAGSRLARRDTCGVTGGRVDGALVQAQYPLGDRWPEPRAEVLRGQMARLRLRQRTPSDAT